jgi:hypothetical protein
MPRKPKLPPIPELHIESLSTGRVLRPKTVPDDFGGEPIAVVQDDSPIKPLLGADEIRATQQRQALANKRKLWTMLKPDKVPQLGMKPEPKLAHNQMQLSNGKVLTVPCNPNALKRRF